MAITEAHKKATIKYAKKTLKRIPLDVQIEKYEMIKERSEELSIGINTYIKNLIDEDLKNNKGG